MPLRERRPSFGVEMEWTSLRIISCLGTREAMQKCVKRAATLESEALSLLLIGGRILGKSLIFHKPAIPYLLNEAISASPMGSYEYEMPLCVRTHWQTLKLTL